MVRTAEFKRVVLELQRNRTTAGLKVAAEVAALLRLELRGLFVKEEGLAHFAALPFARELNPLSGVWRPLDAASVSREIEDAAREAEQFFNETVKQLGLSCEFEVVRESIAATVETMTRGDIYVAAEPAGAWERAAGSHQAVLDAALRSAGAVLLAPRRVARDTGNIVAVARTPDDPSIEIAAAIARAANEELVVVEDFATDAESGAATGRKEAGVRRLRVHDGERPNIHEIASLLAPVRERLVVISADEGFAELASAITARRRVPVLIVEPAR
jgi:hypothetical protein